MIQVTTVSSHKGGPGKTTTAANLAFGMVSVFKSAGLANPKVLLIDTDPQAHATLITTGRMDYGLQNSLATVLAAERKEAAQVMRDTIVQSTWDPDLHILPSSSLIEMSERQLVGVAGAPYRIAEPLGKISHQYAQIIVDTRPNFSLVTEMALVASTDVLVPVEPRYLETVGLLSLIHKIDELRVDWRVPSLKVSGIVITKMDNRIKGHVQLLDDFRTHPVLGKLLRGVIPANEAISYAHHEHQSVFTYDPKAPASRAYAELVGTLIRRIAQGEDGR